MKKYQAGPSRVDVHIRPISNGIIAVIGEGMPGHMGEELFFTDVTELSQALPTLMEDYGYECSLTLNLTAS